MAVELTEAFLARIAGWEAMKSARRLVALGQVQHSDWTPPVLKGLVRDGRVSFRAGLMLKSERDIENVCTCREARARGIICAHSVAVGLHWLRLAPRPNPAGEAVSRPCAGVSPFGEGQRPGDAPRPAGSEPGSACERNRGAATNRLERAAPGAAGEPAEIFVILPPNLAPALARGKVMVCFEGGRTGGRRPLNALPRGRPFCFSAPDTALLDHVEALAGGETPAGLMLGPSDFAGLLSVLVGHPRVTLGKSVPVEVRSDPWRGALGAELQSNGEITLTLKQPGPGLLRVEQTWVYHDRCFQPVLLPACCAGLFGGPVRIARSQVPQFVREDWPRLQAAADVETNFEVDDFSVETLPPRFRLHLAGGLARLEATLDCAYGSRVVRAAGATDDEPWLPDPEHPTRYALRDVAAEGAAVARLLRQGFSGPDAQGRYLLTGQNAVLNFFAREYPRLQREWQVTLEERLERSTAHNLERIEPRFEITPSGVQWFDLGVSFQSSSGERLAPADIQRLLLSGQGYTRLRNGKLAVLDTGAVEDLREVLLDCAPQQHEGKYRMRQTQAGFVEATLAEHGWQALAPPSWRERARHWSGESKPVCPPLGRLDEVLRPYQKEGVAWLHFLRAHGFSGLLADEMGLGKTLQVLALLQSRPAEARGPALVVCPTSLVWNWVAEARKFTPHLRVLALSGADRTPLFEQIPRSDLVVTSYGLVRRDRERYRDLEFDTVVLDEAQHIKNRQTQNAQAVKAIRARHRLALTGTPLENSVQDLWSLFDFLMPGYLGGATDFRERYELPIMRDRNPDAQARLARRVRPFLLRRLKRDVASELPARIEQTAFCELNEEQRAVYRQLLEAGRSQVLAADPRSARSRLIALQTLLRLRQVCCDLRLLALDEAPRAPSGKLELFSELLEEVLDGGHRVLVFSQFVSMLTLLRERLAAEGVEFCYLDGSTPDRAEVITRFQRTRIPVFLISLKAGGVGLNLSGADTVIHFDPWWNPAVEAQATDRAHRLGQTRVVTSYKLITRGTVEEKILQLQQRKRELIQATLGGEEEFVGALSWEEMVALLAP